MSVLLTDEEITQVATDIGAAQRELRAAMQKWETLRRKAQDLGITVETMSTGPAYVFWVRELRYAPTVAVTIVEDVS